MRVECTVTTMDLENESGRTVEGVCAECSRCGHQTESFGTSEASVRRCLVMLRDECPESESNYYVDADE